mmetsp:Transcript_78016/g.123081  ORF Transcript_78016/g.123081 Transcript_78016/m.123081 type:complete len:82 (-) Transcript_78016:201-446(-)
MVASAGISNQSPLVAEVALLKAIEQTRICANAWNNKCKPATKDNTWYRLVVCRAAKKAFVMERSLAIEPQPDDCEQISVSP